MNSIYSKMSGSKIKNIVFDLGGVLLELDFTKTLQEMIQILKMDIESIGFDNPLFHIMKEYGNGSMKTEDFFKNVRQRSTVNIPTEEEITHAWCAMFVGWQDYKLELLNDLRKEYKVFLLSNTNEVHLSWIRKNISDKYGIDNFEEKYFDKAYYSHELSMQKPDPVIFDFVAHDAEIDPLYTLFIDDSPENIVGAKAAGWQAIHYAPGSDLKKMLLNKLN